MATPALPRDRGELHRIRHSLPASGEVLVFQVVRRQSRALLVLLAITAIALAACSSSGGTTAPGGNNPAGTNAGGNNPAITNAPGGGGGGDLSGADAAFANISSYKFNLTIAGGPYSGMLSMLGSAAGTGNAAISVSGTVTVKPEKASDVMIATMHTISIGGFDYTDLGTGQFIKSASSGTSTADSFSPSSMFSSFGSMSDYSKVGSESKNGVDTDHYQANTSAFAGMGSSLGVAATATWTGDIWIAKSGGYPVSSAIFAKTSDGTVAFQMTFDITNVNDSSLKITAPTNVMAI